MSEIASIDLTRELVDAFNSKDLEKTISMVADDSIWTTSTGTFRGKAEVNRYLVWLFESLKDFKLIEKGIGMVAKDRWSVIEYSVTGVYEKKPIEFSGYSTYEFDKSNKIKSYTIVFDRLDLAEKVADDMVSKKIVHSVVKKVQEGLD